MTEESRNLLPFKIVLAFIKLYNRSIVFYPLPTALRLVDRPSRNDFPLYSRVSLVTFLIGTIYSLSPSMGAVPGTILIQGNLETAEGEPVTGTQLFYIGFYDAETGGNPLGATTGFVAFSSTGRFSIPISLPGPALAANEVWYQLGIDALGDGLDPGDLFPEIVRLQSVPFALLARDTESLGSKPATDYLLSASLENGAWGMAGNVGSASHFLGTTNDASLEFRVEGTRGLVLVPTLAAPHLIGGHPSNSISPGYVASVISGGGNAGMPNRIFDSFATISGGADNTVLDDSGTVGGGFENEAGGSAAVIAGGFRNSTSGNLSALVGGQDNHASGLLSFVGGGLANQSTGLTSTVAGGETNKATAEISTVGGGRLNRALGFRHCRRGA
jgi:hypothetical protein